MGCGSSSAQATAPTEKKEPEAEPVLPTKSETNKEPIKKILLAEKDSDPGKIAKVMLEFPNEVEVQLQGSRSLVALAKKSPHDDRDDAIRYSILQSGALDVLKATAVRFGVTRVEVDTNQQGSSVDVVESAMEAVMHTLMNNGVVMEFMDDSAIEKTCQVLSASVEHNRAFEACCRCIQAATNSCTLEDLEEIRKMFWKHGAGKVLIDVLKKDDLDEYLLQEAIGALRGIVHSDANKSPAVEAGLCELLAKHLNDKRIDGELALEFLLGCAANIQQNYPEHSERLFQVGILEGLCRAIRAHPQVRDVQYFGVFNLGLLAHQAPRSVNDLKDAGCLALVSDMQKRYQDDAVLLKFVNVAILLLQADPEQ